MKLITLLNVRRVVTLPGDRIVTESGHQGAADGGSGVVFLDMGLVTLISW